MSSVDMDNMIDMINDMEKQDGTRNGVPITDEWSTANA
jgi:hypothetical protein